ncbi:hypothetical protein [Solirhodobacter olei]|uniref:hypothetical protein n=1 Tax=Solirhodobacter olei TaxID=2493082 RepID=UPI000FDA498B|nr:hypothetical protein [Solirhodobacter olei]
MQAHSHQSLPAFGAVPRERPVAQSGPVLGWLEARHPATIRLAVVLGCTAFWASVALSIVHVL